MVLTAGRVTNEIENMEVDELNKCLAKFYVSVSKTDGSYYKKTSLLSIRAALDRHLKAPPNNKKFSICDNNMFSRANKTLRLSQASCMVASQLKPMCLQFALLLFLQLAHKLGTLSDGDAKDDASSGRASANNL